MGNVRQESRALRWLGLIVGVLALAGCSATRLFYSHLDWLAFQALDERFGVRTDQADWVEHRLDVLHRWHRQTQLPAYRETLDALSARFADGLTATDLHWLEARIERHRRALVERIVPELAVFMADLDAAQRERYAAVTEEQLAEAAEPLALEPKARVAERLEQFVERIEPWTGDLTRAQRRGLEGDVARQPDLLAPWLDQRRQRRDALLDLLARQPEPAQIENLLFGWWRDLDRAYPPDYVIARHAARDQLFELLVRLDDRLSDEQRERVQAKLNDYRETIETVIAAR
ncbi:MAG: DUF6279 family lipoprotein [Gammaproteobacteria bacterium]|jgi:hypothetical protein